MKLGNDMAAHASATRAGPPPGRAAAPAEGQESAAAGEDKVTLSLLGQAFEQLAKAAELARAAKSEGREPIEAYQRVPIVNVYSGAEFARVIAPTLPRDDTYFSHLAVRSGTRVTPVPRSLPETNASQPAAPDSAAGQPEPAEGPGAAEALSRLQAGRALYEALLDPALAKTRARLTGE